MSSRRLSPVYITVDSKNSIQHKSITPTELFGINPLSDTLFYSFESNYPPLEKYYVGRREHMDLVLQNRHTDELYNGLEIKLTALPDSTTDSLSEDHYSCELVIRPSTICYLAATICKHYDSIRKRSRLKELLGEFPRIKHWDVPDEVLPYFEEICGAVNAVAKDMHKFQTPLIVQPIWKTLGRKSVLADNCLDAFVWSNLATIHLCTQGDLPSTRISRPQRSIVWIYKMLFEFYVHGHFDYEGIINDLAYGTKNDKAFAVSGQVTYPLLKNKILLKPRIAKDEIRHIILGGGQHLLSPERRFDSLIVNTLTLFVEP